jgi:sugar phosphate isomerase/epimerase
MQAAGTPDSGPALGIDKLSVFGMPPVEFVTLAAELGCNSIGIGLASLPGYNPHGYRPWSLRDDTNLRRDLVAASRDRGIAIALVEGFAHVPGEAMDRFAADLDLVAEIGGERLNLVSLDKDLQATIDHFAAFTEMAAQRGLEVSAEMGSLGPIAGVDAAQALVAGVGMANFSLLIDTMHFFRLGNSVADFAALDPAMIGYVQLCDAPLTKRFDTYIEEAMYERMVPGEGELPLHALAPLIPPEVVVSLELPIRSQAEAGLGPRERLAPCVAAAKAMLTEARSIMGEK